MDAEGGRVAARIARVRREKKSTQKNKGGSASITPTNCVFGLGCFTIIMPNCDAAWLRSW